ncbi:MAG: LLM class flavin-dependent oxidoreductase [Gammaproteobacteria bacterium]|nr:LLM class flavin-dependent oxidoreductase [Gammaproteobacteria bacterium]
MKLGILAGMGADWRDSVAKVQIAESLGYSLVATGEAWGPSTLPWMTLLATHTEKIEIGTSILNCFSRSPAAIAQEFATLEMLSKGRMVCGLGSSGHRVIEHFHGISFDRPLRRLREYTEIIKLLLRGEQLHYEGKIFQMSRNFRLDFARQRPEVPVYIAAITSKSIAQTGAIADGIFPIHWPSARFKSLRQELKDGADSAGRENAELTIAPFTNVYIGDVDNDENLWQSARQPLFHYINRMGDFYWNMLASNGFSEEVANSRAAWQNRDREGAFAAISKEMVQAIQVIGEPGDISRQLRNRSEDGADIQLIPMPSGTLDEVEKQLKQFIE